MSRPTKIHIDLNAVRHNLGVVKETAPSSCVVACVKANAYGHGAIQIANALTDADMFGVACLEEAIELQDRGDIKQPILLLEGFFDEGELAEISSRRFQTVVHSNQQLEQIVAKPLSYPVPVWLKIDTGMHRLGVSPDQAAQAYARLVESPSVSSVRLMTHFACSEELQNPFTDTQFRRFEEVTNSLAAESSLANSAAIMARPETHKEWVRPGFMLYGNSPLPEPNASYLLQPAMTFSTRVISLQEIKAGEGIGYNHAWRAERDSTIAIAAVGYGDGYPRNTVSGCPVLVNGREARTAGNVAMDLLAIDVSDLPNPRIGDFVELWGENLSVNRVAAHSAYSPYELLTRMPLRAERFYSGG